MTDEDFLNKLLANGAFTAKAKAVWPQMMPRHTQLLELLLKREFISNEGLQTVFNHNTLKTIHNWMHYIRKYTGAEIKNTYGVGYSMKLEDRKRLTKEINDAQPL